MTYSIALFALTLLLLGTYAFFSLKRDGWRRYVGPIGFGIWSIVSFVNFSNSIGDCVPEWLAFSTKMDIVAIAYDEHVAIYLWGVQAGKPKCVALPWSEEQAKEVREGENGGGDLEYVWGTGPSGEGSVHPKPQPPLPPKDINN
jgi:hypothetical protein